MTRRRHSLLHLAVVAFGAACAEPEAPLVQQEEGVAISFTDVTHGAGLGDFRHVTGAFGNVWFPETMGAGGGFLDYDGDGILDVMLVAGGVLRAEDEAPPAVRLFRGNGDGSFVETTHEAGLSALHAYAYGVASADYDNDGDPDVVVTTQKENLLLRNDDGIFVNTARKAGLADEALWSTAAVFLDADRDGWLDLYVGQYVDWTPESDIFCNRIEAKKSYCTPEAYAGVSGRFYHNNRDGTFTDRSDVGNFDNAPGKTLAALSLDYNRDSWPDLLVANDTQRDLLFVNQGDGTFEEAGMRSGIAFDERGRARAGMGIDAGVVDSTNETTVFIGHFSSEMVGVYRHKSNGFFVDRAATSRIGRASLPALTFGILLADVDLDTDLDLFAANGHITEDVEATGEGILYRQRPQLYLNVGGGLFTEILPNPDNALSQRMVARGAAWADYDRDGDVDILVTENGGRAYLFRNDLVARNFLQVRLIGSGSNRDAIGSRVIVWTDTRRMERYIRAGSSYLSQSQHDAHFGLGTAGAVDSMHIHWPSGNVTKRGVVHGNQVLEVYEDG